MEADLQITGSLELTTPLGARINAKITSVDDANRILRKTGRLGWTSGEIPPGGLILPYAQANDFDWNLIGAREFEIDVIEEGIAVKKKAVIHRGLAYKRRDCPAVKRNGVSYPDMVKYSRGAKEFDGEEHREVDRNERIQYVTLITFRGRGQLIEEYRKP